MSIRAELDVPHTRARPHLIVVSYMAGNRFSPRGIRTRALLHGLQDAWDIELIAGPIHTRPPARDPQRGGGLLRKTLRFAHLSIMLDKYEFWARRRFGSWQPRADAALLIGFPFSPLTYAARRLARCGIPYVVDAGDTWVLTSLRPETRGLGRLRGRRAEYGLWRHAAGAVVTTEAQARALSALFPRLPTLIRPNGFSPADHVAGEVGRRPAARGSRSLLRLVHFGDISSDRVSIADFLEALAASGFWDEVQFHEYGSDWTNTLGRLRNVTVVFHEPQEWSGIVASADDYDVAVVVGNRDPMLLPSKVIPYLQLPIPRLAVVDGTENALADYIREKQGWTLVQVGSPDAVDTVRKHISRRWSDAELAPPEGESWDHVTATIAQFLDTVIFRRNAATSGLEKQRGDRGEAVAHGSTDC